MEILRELSVSNFKNKKTGKDLPCIISKKHAVETAKTSNRLLGS